MTRARRSSSQAHRRVNRRRGVALLLAVFAVIVVGTTTAAYVSSRDTSVLVAKNAQQAADARALAAAGMEVASTILCNGDSGWRTQHSNGRLLSNYAIDGGTVTVDLIDIKRRDAGAPNPVPDSTTTEVEVTVSSNRNGIVWTSVSNISIPSVVHGEYAIFAERYLNAFAGKHFIGRWPNAPASSKKLRVNMATAAQLAALSAVARVPSTGVYLETGTAFETVVADAVKRDADSQKGSWVYYPSGGTALVVQGGAAPLVATKPMDPGKTVSMKSVPDTPTIAGTYTKYTNTLKLNGVTGTYGPFQVKSTLAPAVNLKDLEITGNSVVTLTAGTYEVWGSFKMDSSRLIIQGDVRIVVNPNLTKTGLDWKDSSVELDANATLEIYNGYSASIRHCWVGSRYICVSEPSTSARDGDPHLKSWMGTFVPTACTPAAPSHPLYIEPWRIRFYPMKSFLSSAFTWEFNDSAVVGSIFLPTNLIRCTGNTRIYGRMASRDLTMEDTASLYYDHGLDLVSGFTEGMAPARGGDPALMFPTRVLKYGFDAENAR